MIKNLKLKFVLVFLLLVVSVFITSSCYAQDYPEFPTYEDYKYNEYVIYYRTSDNKLILWHFASDYENSFEFKCDILTDTIMGCYVVPNNDVYYNYYFLSGNSWILDPNSTNTNYFHRSSGHHNLPSNVKNGIVFTTIDITNYDTGELLFAGEKQLDLSFDYDLVGTKRGQVKLSISGLDSSLNMYGYVGCENKFNVGDVLDTSLIAENLRMISVLLDKSDLDCYLYDGEKFLYYIVDENNIILDIGYITEMCEGYYLYGFPVNDGVDFVFLNNGVPYWSDDFTFKYQVNNGKLFTKNEVVSSGSYVYIETDKTVHNTTYYGFVYDSNGSEISKASITSINDLSNIHVVSLATRYREFSTGWFSDTTSVYELYNLTLAGTNPDGSYIDFTNYSVRWSIEPYTTLLETIKVNNNDYSKDFGTVSGFDSVYGILDFELEIHQLLDKRVSAFDIVFEIYDSNDNLVLKHVVNSDDIVKDQVIYNENFPNRPSYDILDNPNYSGGNKYPNSDNIQNWEIDDFVSYLGTDNSVFNFFWAFLNNMPTWISTPLSILLIGLVIITLYKFIRG